MIALEAGVVAAVAEFDRRTFLRVTLLATGMGAWSIGCASNTPTWMTPPPDQPLQALSPRAYATLTAAGACIAGPRVAAEIVAGRLRPGPVADAWLARTPTLRDPLLQALTVLEFGVYPLMHKLRAFTSLTDTGRDTVLVGLRDGRLGLQRALFGGIRSMALLAVYLTPEAHALVDYPAPFGTDAVTIGDAMAPLPPA